VRVGRGAGRVGAGGAGAVRDAGAPQTVLGLAPASGAEDPVSVKRSGSVMVLVAALLLAACSLLPGGPQPVTFTLNGAEVTCHATQSSIQGAEATGPGSQTESFCRARARDAIGTLLTRVPNAQVQTVEIAADGSAVVCYGPSGSSTCADVLPALPGL
jgi:hypothetical protein